MLLIVTGKSRSGKSTSLHRLVRTALATTAWAQVLLADGKSIELLRYATPALRVYGGDKAEAFAALTATADLHKRNLLCTTENQVTLIDFDELGYGWRAYDLAVLFWSMRTLPQAEQVCQAYLEGYQQWRRLSTAELAAIPSFVAVRHIWVIGIEIARALSGYYATGWISDTYFDQQLAFPREWMQKI